ncbi:MAG: type II secretion system secretin GspD [Nitrospinota bacterium]
MIRRARILAAVFLLLLFVGQVHSAPEGKKTDQLITMDFKDADILSVIKFISELTEKNFLVDDKVRGKVTIFSPTKITIEEAYTVFKSILEVYGFTVVPSGKIVKVVPLAEAKQKSVQMLSSSENLLSEDRVITRLIPLKFIEANVLLPVVKPLLSNTSFVTSYMPSNTLIVTDLASNVKKLLAIVENLDQEKSKESMPEVRIIGLRHANAKIIANKVEGVFDAKKTERKRRKGKRQNKKPVKVIPAERINSLILIGESGNLDEAKRIIARLDGESPAGTGKINVYSLQNASAEDLGKVLQGLTAKVRRPNTPQRKGTLELKEEVIVTPYKPTNSLIIIASPQDYDVIKKVIEQLDVRRPQVFVEAMIMEVKTDKANEFGIEWRTTSDFTKGGVKGFGGTNLGNIEGAATNPLSGTAGLAVGIVDGTIEFKGTEFVNLGALMKTIQSETDINILSTPNILTMDNEEAEIMVGENIPVSKGESRDTGGNIINNVERKDIGLILRIKPQISESDYVKLNIFHEISDAAEIAAQDRTNPIYTKRSAKTTVVVKDGQNIVIGGLIKDQLNDTVSKVPLLGDIPILGWLFKVKRKTREKTNLMIFLSPHIIRSDKDIDTISRSKTSIMEKSKSQIDGGGKREK